MRKHQRNHLSPDQRSHPCEHCSLRFVLPGDLQRHTRAVHRKETGKARTDTRLLNESAHEEPKKYEELDSSTTSTPKNDVPIDTSPRRRPIVPQPKHFIGDKAKISESTGQRVPRNRKIWSGTIAARRYDKQWQWQYQLRNAEGKLDGRWFPEHCFPEPVYALQDEVCCRRPGHRMGPWIITKYRPLRRYNIEMEGTVVSDVEEYELEPYP